MKKVSINLLTNVVLLLAGIILIIFHGVPNVMLWGCRVMGAMFLLPAIIYLIMVAVRHSDARTSTDYLGVLPAVGGLCFGLVMIIKAHLFDGILQMFMALLLIVLGLFHIIYLFLCCCSTSRVCRSISLSVVCAVPSHNQPIIRLLRIIPSLWMTILLNQSNEYAQGEIPAIPQMAGAAAV